MELTQFEKSKVICRRCEKRIIQSKNDGDQESVEYWEQYYADFKQAMIKDHGNIARDWLDG